VLMNNCHQDWAVRNARQMAQLLGTRPSGATPQAKLL